MKQEYVVGEMEVPAGYKLPWAVLGWCCLVGQLPLGCFLESTGSRGWGTTSIQHTSGTLASTLELMFEEEL